MLAEYTDVISSKDFSAAVPKHDVHHTVPTVPSPPVFAKARRLDAEKLESARKEFAAMEAAGVIRHLTLLGLVLCIWYGSLMEPGPLAVIIAG